MSARFPGEPFSPDRLPDPNAPAPGPESIFHTIYRAAVTGADAYRVTRTAVRREGTVLRLGNRFVPLARYHEIAFLALGSAAVSQALAVSAALGDRLTQGFVVGPDPLPREVPFRSRVEPTGWPARSPVADEAVELAGGLTERDLLLVLLSPGALGFLAKTPADVPVDEWTRWLHALPDRGATSGEVSLAVRVLADGAVGGRLAAATRAD
ncbi:MAG TPA: DUF4147 domain-containing protein, partial [Thermoplasmata archaeon]|nr:DUF4147 domain-containing protein [Thermoplasmata archaeon]